MQTVDSFWSESFVMPQGQLSLLEPESIPIEPLVKDSDQWYTPDNELKLVAEALGGSIGLDPTSDPDRRTPAKRHITERENCLIQMADDETIFCNPPFSNPLPFVQWIAEQVAEGRSPQAIMLCKLGVVSNKGTGATIGQHASALCFPRRINFIPGQGVINRLKREFLEGKRLNSKPSSADFDVVYIHFGGSNATVRFIRTFREHGTASLLPSGYGRFVPLDF